MGNQTGVATDRQLSASILEALRIRAAQRDQGVPEDVIARDFEQTVRACWPYSREWKFLCGECRDYGMVTHQCDGSRQCGRDKPHAPHDYVIPCWCTKGDRFKAKSKTETDFTEATKSKPKPFARFGR